MSANSSWESGEQPSLDAHSAEKAPSHPLNSSLHEANFAPGSSDFWQTEESWAPVSTGTSWTDSGQSHLVTSERQRVGQGVCQDGSWASQLGNVRLLVRLWFTEGPAEDGGPVCLLFFFFFLLFVSEWRAEINPLSERKLSLALLAPAYRWWSRFDDFSVPRIIRQKSRGRTLSLPGGRGVLQEDSSLCSLPPIDHSQKMMRKVPGARHKPWAQTGLGTWRY